MAFTIANWACISESLNQGQETVTPFGGSPTVLNAPNAFFYGSPNDTVAQITTSGYFNEQIASLCVGDWIQGNGTDTTFSVYVSSVSSGVVTVVGTIMGSLSPFAVSGNFLIAPAANALTAHAGGGQGSALLLNDEINNVTTVATVGDSVALPVSIAGMSLIVINDAANAMQVFGSGTDTIDDVATGTGVAQIGKSVVLYSSPVAGKWYSLGLGLSFNAGGFPLSSVSNALTAHSGGTQAAALALVSSINRVTTVAAAADSVKLPASVAGLKIVVINNGANVMQVFGAGTDTINNVATATGVPQQPNSVVEYYCAVAGLWQAIGLPFGYSAGFQTVSASNTLTAHAGGTQAAGLQLVSAVNNVTTVATAGDSVLLPAAAAGMIVTVTNNGVASMQVYGNGTDTINSIATATGVPQLPGQTVVYTSVAAGNWLTNVNTNPNPIQFASVALTAAQFNGMYATPVQLVAAPGANKLILVDHIELLMTYVSANYAAGGVAAGQYDSTANGAGVIATTTLSAATFQAAASTGFTFNTGVVPLTFSTCVNKGIYLSNITQAFTTGDSTFVAKVFYRVLNTVGAL